nr:MAG TPA: cysteine-rich protein [Caudoviricetes sp.]
MFDALKMLVYKFNEQKKELRQNLKRFFCRHDYVKKETKGMFSFLIFSSKYHLECPKCGKHSSIEPWLNYREEEE